MDYNGLPKEIEKELRVSYLSVAIGKVAGAIIILIGSIVSLTSLAFNSGVGFGSGITIMFSAMPIFLMVQIVDDTRRNRILLKHLLIQQSSISDLTSPPPPPPLNNTKYRVSSNRPKKI